MPGLAAGRSWSTALWIISALVCLAMVWKGFSYSTSRLSDFAGYYAASAMVASHDTLAYLYDDARFQERVRGNGIAEPTIIYYVNPPPASLPVLTVVWMTPFAAKTAWDVTLLAVLFAVYLIMRKLLEIRAGSLAAPLVFALLFCTIPFLQNLQRGQFYPWLLLLVVILWYGYDRSRPLLVAVPLAVLILVKYFGWLFLLLLIVERRWRETLWTLVTLAVFGTGSLLFFGTETYVAHGERLVSALGTMDFSLTGLPCVPAFFGALFVLHPRWNPAPLMDVPWLAGLLTLASLVVAVVLTLLLTRKMQSDRHATRFFCFLVISVAFTPLAADHHYLLVALPLAYLVNIATHQKAIRSLVIVAVTVYLAAGWLPYSPIAQYGGLMKLVCFPRLYGAFATWALLIIRYPARFQFERA